MSRKVARTILTIALALAIIVVVAIILIPTEESRSEMAGAQRKANKQAAERAAAELKSEGINILGVTTITPSSKAGYADAISRAAGFTPIILSGGKLELRPSCAQIVTLQEDHEPPLMLVFLFHTAFDRPPMQPKLVPGFDCDLVLVETRTSWLENQDHADVLELVFKADGVFPGTPFTKNPKLSGAHKVEVAIYSSYLGATELNVVRHAIESSSTL